MRADRRETLELARREAEPLADIIAQPGEAQGVVPLLPEEGVRQASEDTTTAGVLSRQAAEVAVEDQGGVVAAEAARVGL